MSIFLGIDTGGTYTDAVLIRDERDILASAKSLTTKDDLSRGIGGAVAAVLAQSGIAAKDIALVSMSTTLATNALVEGQGGRVALVAIGFSPADMNRAGLEQVIGDDPVVFVGGGHNHAGGAALALDEDALRQAVKRIGDDVGAFAVAAQFATRNPAHELAARQIIRDLTGKPVTCSHELSARLNGPKRALTAMLNARLVSMIEHLIAATEGLMAQHGIDAPCMVVRGDGALIAANVARARPIETILSGPAASIVGARWLTHVDNAIVSDIGGTTTDIAILRDGQPLIDADGALVGGHRTMVEAVAMRTSGLGGDSAVQLVHEGLSSVLRLGPRRVLPISLLAHETPELVHTALDEALARERLSEFDGQFVRAVNRIGRNETGLNAREADVLARLGNALHPLASIVKTRTDMPAIHKLIARGLAQRGALTPSDASHILGLQSGWDALAAQKAAALFARQKTNAGVVFAGDGASVARAVIDQLHRQTAECLMAAALAEDGFSNPDELARHSLVLAGQPGHAGAARIRVGLGMPLVGLGASAGTYYPEVGRLLDCATVLPEHGGVANAIGAVVGQVTMRASLTVTAPSEGVFRLHLPDGPLDMAIEDDAAAHARNFVACEAALQAEAAGAEGIHITPGEAITRSQIEGRSVFVEAQFTAAASGRPRTAQNAAMA
ncbi:MAG: hydantoinase/oxoprolinase family protein [Paracoccaceae bacterium]